MSAQMDALSSFAFLTDSIPSWLKQVEDLSSHTTKRHAEFAAEYTRLLKYARPRKQKSPSLISNRSSEGQLENEKKKETTAAKSHISSSYPASDARLELNPLEAGNKYIFANARRQKKPTGASVRSGASGPQKFRQRHAVVIYYDSHVQERFEVMVKNISTARNNLRKGKKSRLLARGPMFPSFEPTSNGYNLPGDDFKRNIIMAQFSVNPKVGNTFSPKSTSQSFDEAFFDIADKDLEQAQNLCETAAHQFLRDGDSTLELRTIKEKLETVHCLASSVVEKLEEEDRLQKEREEAVTTVDEQDSNNTKTHETLTTSIKAKTGPMLTDDHLAAIEVDDDDDGDDGDGEFDISRYKAMLRPHAVRV